MIPMNKLIELICNSNHIAVTSHVDPDGDSIGSILALGTALKQKNGNVEIFVNDTLSNKYDFLPGYSLIKSYDAIQDKSFDLIFVLDCGDEHRLGSSVECLEKSKSVVNLDHHISNNHFGDINIVDVNASSTCEIVYLLLSELNFRIDRAIATCIYTGIVTDSGNFVYDNATDRTHLIASELLKYNIDKQEIMYNLYQRKSIHSLKFLGHCLSNMELELDNSLAIFTITASSLKEFMVPYSDVEGIVNYGRDIETVKISVALREDKDHKVKMSFRSKDDDVDVRALAELFNGGGHKKAAGATISTSLAEAKMLVIEKSKQFIRR